MVAASYVLAPELVPVGVPSGAPFRVPKRVVVLLLENEPRLILRSKVPLTVLVLPLQHKAARPIPQPVAVLVAFVFVFRIQP